jgi:hypothetical protein
MPQTPKPPKPRPLAPQMLLSKILESFVSKLGSLKAEIPALVEVRPPPGVLGSTSARG